MHVNVPGKSGKSAPRFLVLSNCSTSLACRCGNMSCVDGSNSITRVPGSRRTDCSDDICSPCAHLTTPLSTCRPAGKQASLNATKFMEGTLAVTQKHKGHILVEHQLYSLTNAACNIKLTDSLSLT